MKGMWSLETFERASDLLIAGFLASFALTVSAKRNRAKYNVTAIRTKTDR
jgi:hypothetical protein